MCLVVWVCIKGFTLTYLSPLCMAVVSACVLKGETAKLLKHWSVTVMERCRNPWHDVCRNSDIEVYIQIRGEKVPICRRCWGRIAEKDLEW